MTTLPALRRAFGDLPVVRVASLGPDGPHLAALWFVWREDAVYASCRRAGRTARNVQRDPRVALLLDRGHRWVELAGVELLGTATVLAPDHPSMRGPISAWHEKYRALLSGEGFERFAAAVPDLAFLRVEVRRAVAWDHGSG
ncbi:MAG TPA: pyridoxamine 5'-phosphate oxidase family protein [Actinomycetota bacterium]|nr:pyridoxamine 5'-phosphate oxidase family protein [Actinomycetota bacterium]